MKYAALLALAFLQVLLSIVLSHKRHSKVSRTFILFSAILFLWTAANITLDYTLGRDQSSFSGGFSQLTILNAANSLGFFFGALSILMLSRLMLVFPQKRKEDLLSTTILYGGLAVAGLSLLPIVSGGFEVVADKNQPQYVGGALVGVLLAYFLIAAGFCVSVAIQALRKHPTEAVRRQTQTILTGLLLTAVTAITIIVVLPLLVENDSYVFLGYFAPFIFTFTMAYSIFKQGFLEFRAVVARSVAYILSIGLVASLYGFIVFFLAKFFFGLQVPFGAEVFLSVATGAVALLFGPFKTAFNRYTKKLFYQDSYEPQELYGQLNRMLVSSLDVKYLMMQSISIIESAIKPEFAMIGLRDGPNNQRIYASRKHNLSDEDIAKLRSKTPLLKKKVIITDELDDGKHSEIKSLLRRHDIAVLVRLTQQIRSGEEGLGYLLLGGKKSGNAYTQLDAQVLDAVANELIIAIQNALHYEEIQQFNLSLQAKVDEATRKLRSTNEKLKALDETKDDFISMASHQLRTPLTSVKGYLSMVLEGDAGEINETQRKMLSQAYTSSQRMVYLIADLLNVSRLRTGKFVIESGPTDLSKMIDEEIGQLTETATARSLTLEYHRPKDFPSLMLDETKTRQILMNFIDNAIYYTPKDGHIKIELKDTGPTVEFRVIDDGIGVPKNEQHHLFTKFYRAGNARKARPDGTGLGLFMAKKVITAQEGALIFESKEGEGSTFGFIFTKSKLSHVEAEVAREAIAVPHTPVQG